MASRGRQSDSIGERSQQVATAGTLRPSSQRIDVIDALRGFALAGIVLVHMVEQYLGTMPPPELAEVFRQGLADQVIQGFLDLFFRGKFFAIFSILFGLSFFIQMDRAASRGVRFHGRFVWRVLLLLFIGYAHSLFYRGDILTIYAILGLFLVLFYRVQSTLILALAGAIFVGLGRYAVFALYGSDTILPYGDFSPQAPHNVAYFAALTSGSLWDVFASNAWHGHMSKMEFQINVFGRWYLTFAFFLVGLWLGRTRLFENLDERHAAIKTMMWRSLAGAIVALVAMIFLFSQSLDPDGQPDFTRWLAMFALTAMDIFNLFLTALIICGFLLAWSRPRGERLLGRLAPYGRMALSNYFLQTVFGTFILYHWGLGLLGTLSNSDAFVIAIAVLALQVAVSTVWLQRLRYGPLEWLWRCATYMHWQPLVKRRE